MGPAFAAPGVAVKEVAKNAIAEAVAITEIVFMLVCNDQAESPFNIMRRARGCDYKKIHTGSIASSNDDGAVIIKFMQRRCLTSGFSPPSTGVSR
jgi:hypothetical protein